MDLPKRVKHPEAKIESKKIVETFTKLGRITFLYFRINVNLIANNIGPDHVQVNCNWKWIVDQKDMLKKIWSG